MEAQNAKNLLQEWAHEQGIALPVYKTTITGQPHKPLFSAECQVAGQTFSTWPEHNSKKAAEKAAASHALTILTKNDSPTLATHVIPAEVAANEFECEGSRVENTSSFPSQQCTGEAIIIIDADNVDVPLALIRQTAASFLFFVARNGSKIMDAYSACDNCMIFTTPCIGKDATDIYLTYETRGIRDTFPDANIAIFTKDHFAQTLGHLANAAHVCTVKELEDWLGPRRVTI